LTRLLTFVFFLSGAAALLFVTLWFHQAGLALGNSVWASSLVLAAFLGGLALGNALVARAGARIRRPVRLYAGLELVIGLTGVLLVLVLPRLAPGLGGALAAEPEATGAETVSSTSVFHSPQPSHLPAHLAVTEPQDWQTKAEDARDMA